MTELATTEHEAATANPVDLVEQVASAHDWIFERRGDDEIAVEINGQWCDYRIYFSWIDDICALHFACAFEMRVPSYKRRDITDLLARINEKLAIGHFDLWADEGLPVFRQAVLLRGVGGASVEQVEDMVEIALTECERFYPAFQFVVWGGKSPVEAVQASMLETVGQA
ncbi:MAG: hypothetical protein GEU92_00690 [Alphaproteobacteria bacterium]|nr:hypothetical protein [Alphaproteobacteria bacterium]